MRPGSRQARILGGLAVVCALAAPGGAAADYEEYELKAAFLLNFARLVQWPRSVSPEAGAPLVVGVHGDDGVADEVERALGKARVEGHPVRVRDLERPDQLAGCHLAFLTSADGTPEDWLDEARSRSVLTVGESAGFAERGGVINFFLEGKKLRFEINPVAADRSGLKISSRLLRLARLVEGGT